VKEYINQLVIILGIQIEVIIRGIVMVVVVMLLLMILMGIIIIIKSLLRRFPRT